MLPFLKRKESTSTGLIVKSRSSDKPEQEQEQEEEIQDSSAAAIEQCAMELILAVHLKDVKGVSEALCSAFDILESKPHEEVIEPHSYESQNIKAGKEEY